MFAAAYRRTWSATKAAIEVGYSPKSAAVSGWDMLQRGDVQEELARLAIEAQREFRTSAGEVLRAISEIAMLDPAEVFQHMQAKNGRFYSTIHDIHVMPLHVRRAISSIKVVRENRTAGDGKQDDVVEVKFWNKVAALELLAKHAGLLKDVVQHEHIVRVEELERLDDRALGAHIQAQAERWRRHLEARERARVAVGALPPAPLATKSLRSGSTPSPRGAKGGADAD